MSVLARLPPAFCQQNVDGSQEKEHPVDACQRNPPRPASKSPSATTAAWCANAGCSAPSGHPAVKRHLGSCPQLVDGERLRPARDRCRRAGEHERQDDPRWWRLRWLGATCIDDVRSVVAHLGGTAKAPWAGQRSRRQSPEPVGHLPAQLPVGPRPSQLDRRDNAAELAEPEGQLGRRRRAESVPSG